MSHTSAFTGVNLTVTRKAAGLSQTDLGARLVPPIEYHIVSAWETGNSLPTEAQAKQIAKILGIRHANGRPVDHGAVKPGMKWDYHQTLTPSDFADALPELQKVLGIRSRRQLAKFLQVPDKTLGSAYSEELPTHIKFIIAATLDWRLTDGLVYSLLTAVQRAKVDAAAESFSRRDIFVDSDQRIEVRADPRRASAGRGAKSSKRVRTLKRTRSSNGERPTRRAS